MRATDWYYRPQVTQHNGPNDGHDGEVRQQLGGTSQRENEAAHRGETEDRRPAASNATKVCMDFILSTVGFNFAVTGNNDHTSK